MSWCAGTAPIRPLLLTPLAPDTVAVADGARALLVGGSGLRRAARTRRDRDEQRSDRPTRTEAHADYASRLEASRTPRCSSCGPRARRRRARVRQPAMYLCARIQGIAHRRASASSRTPPAPRRVRCSHLVRHGDPNGGVGAAARERDDQLPSTCCIRRHGRSLGGRRKLLTERAHRRSLRVWGARLCAASDGTIANGDARKMEKATSLAGAAISTTTWTVASQRIGAPRGCEAPPTTTRRGHALSSTRMTRPRSLPGRGF